MSEVKVNKISPRTACGTTTLGDSGDTFTIPAGVTITNNGTAAGFGATGAASWDTTVKTSGFTAVSGVGYFVNTTGGAISVNLPAGTAGDVVAIKDYANTFDTNAVTLVRNGSDKIGGVAVDAVLSVEGLAVTLVYVDATRGWLVTDNGTQDTASTAQYVTATGGTITCSGDYRIHTFTGPGAFCVSNAGNVCGSNLVDYMVVAGGGGSGGNLSHIQQGGGGGAGGFRESPGTASGSYVVSPLGASPAVALSVPVASYPITVGGGGAQGGGGGGVPAVPSGPGAVSGNNSIFNTITSAGGGFGGQPTSCGNNFQSTGEPGASGGGGGGGTGPGGNGGGTGNTPPVSPAQGKDGGPGQPGGPTSGGSGGGATGNGSTAPGSGSTGPAANTGGTGATSSITGSAVARATGGNWGQYCGPTWNPVSNATANTGDGANANSGSGSGNMPTSPPANVDEYWKGRNGGSGIVVIRYKFQN